jgi:hypothetical protein
MFDQQHPARLGCAGGVRCVQMDATQRGGHSAADAALPLVDRERLAAAAAAGISQQRRTAQCAWHVLQLVEALPAPRVCSGASI